MIDLRIGRRAFLRFWAALSLSASAACGATGADGTERSGFASDYPAPFADRDALEQEAGREQPAPTARRSKAPAAGSDSVRPRHVDARVRLVGNPFLSKGAYARNVWDMQVWDGRLYLGHGNSSDDEPSPNAGPIDVVSYDPETSSFTREYTVDEEQIDRFRVVDGMLTIPGHDPREDWSFGNFYRKEGADWQKYRTIPNGVHTYDLLAHRGLMFAALGTPIDRKASNIVLSQDRGATWQEISYAGPIRTVPPSDVYHPNYSRMRTLFELNGRLYGSGEGYARHHLLVRHEGGNTFSVEDTATADSMFPGLRGQPNVWRIERAVNFGDHLVYIGAESVNDHQWLPLGLFAAPAVGLARGIALPDGASPRDIVVSSDGTLYVLVSIKIDESQYIVSVCATKELMNWTEIMRFNCDTFARSFELMGDEFYVGLGQEHDGPAASTGNILTVSIGESF
jgi:hypothetical protein